MAERWILNADSSAPMVLPLVRQRGAVQVTAIETPPPAPRTAMAPRPEGSLPVTREHELRDVKLTLKILPVLDPHAGADHDFAPTGAPEAEGDGTPPGWSGTVRRASSGSEQVAALEDLEQALGQLRTSPRSIAGTLTRVLDDGRRGTLDIVEVLDDGSRWDLAWYVGRHTEITVTFRCLPYWRSDEILIGSATRGPSQRLNIVTGQVPGDVDALARIELSGGTQRSILYAVDQVDGDPLEVACSTLIRPPGSTLATTPWSVSPQVAVSAAVGGTLPAGVWDRVANLETASGPLPRDGRFRVFLRAFSIEAMNMRVRLRWSAGPREAGLTSNEPVTVTTNGIALLDLGVVSCDGYLSGVLETSLPRPEVQLDALIFVPCDGTAGVVNATTGLPQATLIAADLPSSVTSGALVGSAAPPAGTTWTALATHATAFTRTTTGAALAATTGTWRAAGVSAGTFTTLSATVRAPTNTHDPVPGGGTTVADLNAALIVGNAAGATALWGTGIGPPTAWCLAVGFRGPGVDIVNSLYGGLFVWFIQDGVAREKLLGESRFMADGGEATIGLTLQSYSVALNCEFRNPAGVVLDRSTTVVPMWSPPPAGLSVGIASAGRRLGGVGAGVSFSGLTAQTSMVPVDAALVAGQSSRIASSGVSRVAASGVRGPLVPEGSLPRLPASGPEGTAARVAVLATLGLLGDQSDGILAGVHAPLTTDVYATPRWLQLPGEPS